MSFPYMCVPKSEIPTNTTYVLVPKSEYDQEQNQKPLSICPLTDALGEIKKLKNTIDRLNEKNDKLVSHINCLLDIIQTLSDNDNEEDE